MLSGALIERIVKGQVTLQDLNNLRSVFYTEHTKARKQIFLNSLEQLSNDALHKLNIAIAKNVKDLIPENDDCYYWREPNDRILIDLLVLEAKCCNMRVEVKDSELNLFPDAIPVFLQDIYYVLKENSYFKPETIDMKMAKSMCWYAEKIARQDETIGEGLISEAKQKYIAELSKSKISEQMKPMEIVPARHNDYEIKLLASNIIKIYSTDVITANVKTALEGFQKKNNIIIFDPICKDLANHIITELCFNKLNNNLDLIKIVSDISEDKIFDAINSKSFVQTICSFSPSGKNKSLDCRQLPKIVERIIKKYIKNAEYFTENDDNGVKLDGLNGEVMFSTNNTQDLEQNNKNENGLLWRAYKLGDDVKIITVWHAWTSEEELV